MLTGVVDWLKLWFVVDHADVEGAGAGTYTIFFAAVMEMWFSLLTLCVSRACCHFGHSTDLTEWPSVWHAVQNIRVHSVVG